MSGIWTFVADRKLRLLHFEVGTKTIPLAAPLYVERGDIFEVEWDGGPKAIARVVAAAA